MATSGLRDWTEPAVFVTVTVAKQRDQFAHVIAFGWMKYSVSRRVLQQIFAKTSTYFPN